MQAIRLTAPGQPLEAHTLPDPSPGEGEIVVDIRRAGICHTDAHYRAQEGRTVLPVTLGHEIAGVVSAVGANVSSVAEGDRVALHYLTSCGECDRCLRHGEQFCTTGTMIGRHRDGGYAQRILVPAVNAVPIPDEVPFDAAAIMMCSTATAYHALRLASPESRDSLAILGLGGLGVSAVQLAKTFGITELYAIDVVPEKLELAASFGATPIDARNDVRKAIYDATEGRGVDIVLDFAGNAGATHAALRALAAGGRLVLVAINLRELTIDPFSDVLAKERRIIGCSDHTRAELVELMELARTGAIDLSRAITRTVPLEAAPINGVLDELEARTGHLRAVIEVG